MIRSVNDEQIIIFDGLREPVNDDLKQSSRKWWTRIPPWLPARAPLTRISCEPIDRTSHRCCNPFKWQVLPTITDLRARASISVTI